jgi:DUF1680 family protein
MNTEAGSMDPAPLPRLAPVAFTDVEIADAFWSPRRATNRLVSIPVNFANLEKAGNLSNLRLAAERATEGYQGPVFMDSDVYKALEAACYSLATDPDPVLEKQVEDIVGILSAAQHADGYLNSYYTVKEPGRRWVNLRDNHELYCAGHLIEAAVAHHMATGRTNLLRIACRFADHIDSIFGPAPKRMGYPGHPEIELALVKLARITGDSRYLELARFFVLHRGTHYFAREHRTPEDRYDGTYWQDDVPILEHRNIKGHAVRAAYLLSGATDLVAEAADTSLLKMLHRVWRNTIERNLYLTGGIGPSAHNEGFTEDYDLPNRSAYQETCATIALVQWAHRLALLHGDARYADVVERGLYNGVLAGASQDGQRFFYVNPLSSDGGHHRSPWFGCACCPPNIARTLASLGGYAYAMDSKGGVFVNLYLQGSARLRFPWGREARLVVTTDYPWDGQVTLRWEVDGPPITADLWTRIPGWCDSARFRLNGQELADSPEMVRGYARIPGTWRKGDEVAIEFSMPIRRIAAHPRVQADRGLAALQRGPLVYCLEQVDQTHPISALYLSIEEELASQAMPDLLGGVVVLRGHARLAGTLDWTRRLYQPCPDPQQVPIVAIPYYAWDNRAAGAMEVWLPVAPRTAVPGGLETQARVSLSHTSANCDPAAIRDGKEPTGSRRHPGRLCHWWPRKGTREWVAYSWERPVTIAGARVYWFDDTGSGECRLPAAWDLEYLSDGEWKPLPIHTEYRVSLDQWAAVECAPVTATSLRINAQLQRGWAAGIHEWQVIEGEE